MAARLIVEATYPTPAQDLFASAISFVDMKAAMKGLASYRGLPDGDAEDGATYRVQMTVWGWMKSDGHTIWVEELNFKDLFIQSRESNPAVARWDHRLSITAIDGATLWRDEVVVDAGWRTAGAVRLARHVYTHRHRTRASLSLRARIEGA